ncbi:MAG: hypothetical protein ACK5N0_14825 [Synechococcaceae cyanobacterium]
MTRRAASEHHSEHHSEHYSEPHLVCRRAGADPFQQRMLKRTAEPLRSRRVRLTIKALSGGLTLQRPSPLPPLRCRQMQAPQRHPWTW